MHVDEDLANTAILIFTGPQINLVATNRCLLRVAFAAVWQLFAFCPDDALNNLLNHLWGGCGDWGVQCVHCFLILVNILDKAG